MGRHSMTYPLISTDLWEHLSPNVKAFSNVGSVRSRFGQGPIVASSDASDRHLKDSTLRLNDL